MGPAAGWAGGHMMPEPLEAGEELIFYVEPDEDRWFPGDRYPRRLVRRLVRGEQMTGYRRLVASLKRGFDAIGVGCRVNEFAALDARPRQVIGLLGKQSALEGGGWRNPMVCGPAMLDHPKDRPDLFERYNARLYLVAGPWMRAMFEPYFGERVKVWPVGIDTELWADFAQERKSTDVLVYVKFLWDQERNCVRVLQPILDTLRRRGVAWETIAAGTYTPAEYLAKLRRARFMVFLCEHETQGQAYQEALSCNVPVLAWDQGIWLDPKATRYEKQPVPASSVPYFDATCGVRFRTVEEFPEALDTFLCGTYRPRGYVLENLGLAASARAYLNHLRQAAG